MRSLVYLRGQAGLIREVWVLVDILDLYSWIGVDGFARIQQFARVHSRARSNIEPTDLYP